MNNAIFGLLHNVAPLRGSKNLTRTGALPPPIASGILPPVPPAVPGAVPGATPPAVPELGDLRLRYRFDPSGDAGDPMNLGRFSHLNENLRGSTEGRKFRTNLVDFDASTGAAVPVSPDAYDLHRAEFDRLVANPVAEPVAAELKGPSTLQMVAGGLGALLMPRMAAAALASPFQAASERQARETAEGQARYERARQDRQERMAAAQAGMDSALQRGALRMRQEELRAARGGFGVPGGGETAPAPSPTADAASPAPMGPQSVRVAEAFKKNDLVGARGAAWNSDAALGEGTKGWFSPGITLEMTHLTAAAANARKRANDAYAAIARQKGVAQPGSLAALERQQTDAAGKVDATLRYLDAQKILIARQLDDPRLPAEERKRLEAMQDHAGASIAEKAHYRGRLQRQIEQTAAWKREAVRRVRKGASGAAIGAAIGATRGVRR